MLSSIANFYIISIWQLCGHMVSVAKQEICRIPASMRFGEPAAKPASCQRRQSVFRHASPSTQYTDCHRIKISKFCDSRDMLPSVRFSGVFNFLSMPVAVKLLNRRVNLRAPRHRSRSQNSASLQFLESSSISSSCFAVARPSNPSSYGH